jgi:hypothetical protein
MKMLLGILLTCAESVLLAAQAASAEPNPLLRQYRDGERLIYHMKTKDDRYLAAVGKETFEVQITLSLVDGKILFATMDNPVQTLERECADSALTKCSDAKPRFIERRIEISLERG